MNPFFVIAQKRITLVGFLFLLLSANVFGQVESDESPLQVATDGIIFKHDSVFRMSMRFRMQNRFGYYSTLDQEDKPGYETFVRRLRIRFDGFVLSPKIGYYIQLSFSRADQDLSSGTVAQTVRDAMGYYTFSKRFYIGFGQGKLPGNRQRVISSGNLQLPERSIANATFTLDRDFGFFSYYTLPMGETQKLLIKAAISGGEGRGQLYSTRGLAYTGRVEWLPMGAFRNSGDYSEGDTEFEPKPKLSLAAGYCFNDNTTRSGGQLGSVLTTPVDMGTFITDMMFKHNGWGVMAEYFYRRIDGDSLNPASPVELRNIPQGTGYNFQVSKMISGKDELALRISGVNPKSELKAYQYTFSTQAIGYTHYFNKHRIKVQTYVGFDDRLQNGGIPKFHPYKDRVAALLQVELGI